MGAVDSTSRFVDLFSAAQVLEGNWVRLVPLMPDGYVRHGKRHPPITAEKLAAMDHNFQNRATSGFYQTLLPFNKEHVKLGGKIGSVADTKVEDDGLYGIFDLTPKGRQALEDEEFDYLSPEIRWITVDVKTGEDIGPSLAGVGATNYPFFGDRTAMYSQDAEDRIAEKFEVDDELQRSIITDLASALIDTIRRLGWHIADLGWINEDAVVSDVQNLKDARRSLAIVLAEAAARLPDLSSQRGLFELYAETKEGGDGYSYPKSAHLVALGPKPANWLVRYKAYNDEGVLCADKALLRRAAERIRDFPAELGESAKALLGSAAKDLGEEDPVNIYGGIEMSGNNDPGGASEEMTQVMDRLTALEAHNTELNTTLEEREATIASQGHEIERLNRDGLVQQFTRQAEDFSAIGAENSDLANNLLWLFTADTEENRPHYEFFNELLKTVDAALADSASFGEEGHGHAGEPATDAFDAINKRVAAKAAKMGVAAPQGSPQWNEIVDQLAHEEPALFAEYQKGVGM